MPQTQWRHVSGIFVRWKTGIVANCSVDLIRARKGCRVETGAENLEAELPAAEAPGPERLARSAGIRRRVELAFFEEILRSR